MYLYGSKIKFIKLHNVHNPLQTFTNCWINRKNPLNIFFIVLVQNSNGVDIARTNKYMITFIEQVNQSYNDSFKNNERTYIYFKGIETRVCFTLVVCYFLVRK